MAPKDLTKNFSVLMKCTNKFDCLVYEMFFIHEVMYNLTQFVLRFLISFLISFLLVVLFVHFYCPFTPANFMENFYTSYVHIQLFQKMLSGRTTNVNCRTAIARLKRIVGIEY